MDDLNMTENPTIMEEKPIPGQVGKKITPKRALFSYNSPLILTYVFLCTAILGVNQIWPDFIPSFFMVPGNVSFSFSRDFYKIITYALGHSGWEHLLGNCTLMLLVGPVLEEKYGTGLLLVMVVITAMATGLINGLFFPSFLVGASGVVFMMILLISFTNIRKGQIPITFVLVVIYYIGKEVLASFDPSNNVSEVTHIVGGTIGVGFGFLFGGKKPAKGEKGL